MIRVMITAGGAFLATNMDDLLLLIMFAGSAKTKRQWRAVVWGQLSGIVTLIAVSWLLSFGLMKFAPSWISLLGIIPIAVGVLDLWHERHGWAETSELKQAKVRAVSVPLVWSVTVGDGGDNLSVYIPLFAKQTAADMTMTIAIFLMLTIAWLWLGRRLAQTKVAVVIVERFSTWLMPALLILVGSVILWHGFIH
ncbi:cadmium resistance transporter [Furfurilactobacillus sp. WILCCON 0119]